MSFEEECIQKRNEGYRLPRLVMLYKKYQPLLDEQVLLAGVIITLTNAGVKITRNEIYYAFKKNYKKEYHGDVQSYCTWLYSLCQPSKKKANNTISEQKEAQKEKKGKKLGKSPSKTKKSVKMEDSK